jgi:predicted membrane chloride channel (bestrophin family)
MWERHTSRWRFINNFLYWHRSALLQRVIPQLTVLMIWTHFAIGIIETKSTFLAEVTFPMTSLSLVSGFVASLLALRSNQGLSRLMEARMAFGKVVFYTRDMSSLVANFIYPQNKELGLKLARHLTLFSWLLKNFLRGRKVSGDDEDLIRTMLPDKADADYVLRNRKMPIAVVMRLRQALAQLSHEHALSTAEEFAIDHTIQSMDQSVMLTERIVASPIPPLFTTHAGRLLTFYLFFLPLALHSTGSMNRTGTFLTVLAVGYAMLGMDEISHLMEQPFKLAPLYHLCKNSMRDVADSFCLTMPSLHDHNNRHYTAESQPYWPDGVPTGLE